ncbi:MAG: phosphatidylserine decarboxylase [Thermoplasmata archaeon]|nr:MAG: phosphatidylserine decarboxylase [Thermoplasmata archaeon]
MIAKGGKGIVATAFTLGVSSLLFSGLLTTVNEDAAAILSGLSLLLLTCFLFLLIFFRDPERRVGKGVVSPADGKIIKVDEVEDKDVGKSYLISIFMSIWNVHVNRSPYSGIVSSLTHYKGGHSPAFLEKADRNEKTVTIIDTPLGKIKMVQIAGIVARRIVSYICDGDRVEKGQRVGIIRFGSRVDLYLPCNKIERITVDKGDNVKAGEDTVAEERS